MLHLFDFAFSVIRCLLRLVLDNLVLYGFLGVFDLALDLLFLLRP